MAKNYATLSGKGSAVKAQVPQSQKASKGQKKNRAGGYSFKINDWTKLNRFLVLGSEGSTYYQSSRKLTKQNANAITRLLKSNGKEVVDAIVEVSTEGRAYKNSPALFALALAASCKDLETKQYALANLNKVARTGTHLFEFVAYADSLRGWGKSFQKAVASWYHDKKADKLAYQVCKYASRRLEGELPWSHRDLLRKTHLKPNSVEHNAIFKYVTKGKGAFATGEWNGLKDHPTLSYLWAHEAAKEATTAKEVITLVKNYSLAQESIPTEFKSNVDVSKALIANMPITATIRGLGKFTANGAIQPLSSEVTTICNRITDEEQIKKGMVHPLQFLIAQKTYQQGRGFRGGLTWTPVQAIVDALEEGFYKSFNYVEPTGKNFLLGIDISGSMSWGNCNGVECLTPAEGAAALAMTIARTEKNYFMRGFNTSFVDLGITAKDSLENVLRKTRANNFGGTDCAQPMVYATKHKLDVDTFIVLTDCETWAGRSHPHVALQEYRRQMNKPEAKLVVIGMQTNDVTIADPNDAGMLDVAGFDANIPSLVSEFTLGNI